MRRILIFGLLLLVLVGAGWTALWLYAAGEAGRQLDAWMKSEESQGRTWTCPGRSIGGYPLALAVSCANPTYTGRAGTDTDHWAARSLVAEVGLTHGKRLAVTLGAPLTYKNSSGQADIKADWTAAVVDIDGLPNPDNLTIHAHDLVVTGRFGAAKPETWNAGSLDAAIDMAPQAPDLGFAIVFKGASLPLADDLLGGRAPLEADLNGRLGRADVANAATLPEAIERWRQAGGRIALAQSRVSRSGASVSGSGNVGLDEAHRLQGKVDASFVGLAPVLKRYGIGGNVAAAGSLLSQLFGGGAPKAPTEPGALNLPIRFQDGRLGIGPFRTQVALPPLY